MIVTIITALLVPFLMALSFLIFNLYKKKKSDGLELVVETKPFIVSEYYSRIEQSALDILENQKPVDKTIVLWWGLDGLQLNEDGTLEWISRKKPKPVNQNVSYQPCQPIAPMPQYGMFQSAQAQIDWSKAQNTMLQRQAMQQQQIQNINSVLQSYVVPMAGYMGYNPQYQLTQCCCNWNQI